MLRIVTVILITSTRPFLPLPMRALKAVFFIIWINFFLVKRVDTLARHCHVFCEDAKTTPMATPCEIVVCTVSSSQVMAHTRCTCRCHVFCLRKNHATLMHSSQCGFLLSRSSPTHPKGCPIIIGGPIV